MKHCGRDSAMQGWSFRGREFALFGCLLGGLVPAGAAWAQSPAAEQQAEQFDFDIPPQPLETAVLLYAQQASVQIFFDSERLAGLQGRAVRGRLDYREALRQLLVGLPVSYRFDPDRRVALSRGLNSDATELASQVIRARPLSERDALAMLPRSASVIEREQIERLPPRDAAALLQQSAGVYTAVSGQDPGTSVNIRGIQDFGRVNLSIDGMRQNYQQTGDQQRNGTLYIDPELLSGVMLEKGPSSTQGGAGVIGGVADFRTLQAGDFLEPGKETGGRLRATTGLGGYANGTHFIGSGVFAAGDAQGDLLLAVAERHLGDYQAGSHGELGQLRTFGLSDLLKGQEVDSSAYVMRSRLAKVGLNLYADQRLELSYLQTSTHYDDAYQLDYNGENLYWPKQGTSAIESSTLGLDYHYDPDSPLIDLNAKVYRVNTRNDQYVTAVSPAYSVRYQTRSYGLQLNNSSRFEVGSLAEATLTYGVEAVQDRTDPDTDAQGDYVGVARTTPEGQRTLASLFGNLEYEYDAWLLLSAGLRYDRYWLKGDASFQSPSFNDYAYDLSEQQGKLSPTLGFAIKPGIEGLQLYANWGKGWRPPAITESLASGVRLGSLYSLQRIYPNPFLEPERSTSWEVGVNLLRDDLWIDGDRLTAKVAYFDTEVEDFIYFARGRQFPDGGAGEALDGAYANNTQKTHFRGVEYSLSYDAGSFYGDLSYAHMIGENDFCSRENWLAPAEVGDVVSCSIQGTAEHLPMDRGALTLGARALDRRLDMGARVRYSQGAEISNPTDAADYLYPPDWKRYTVYDLYARLQISEALSLGLSLDNLTDRAYLVPLGDVIAFTLQPGRTLEGTLEYRF